MTVEFEPLSDNPVTQSNRSRNRGILIGFGAATALAIAAVGGYIWYDHHESHQSFTLSGTFTLNTTSSATTGDGCHGTGGYQDIAPGTSISVSDEAGTLLAKGVLSSGHGESGSCYMPFSIDDVPSGKKFYKVEVSHRGEVNYTEAEAKKGISLQLGDSDSSSPTTKTTPAYSPTPTPPPPAASSPGVIALKPNAAGWVYIRTQSGKTRCQVKASEVDCQAPFTRTPFVNGGRANGVRFGADGSTEWVNGDLGDIPVSTIGYDIYEAAGWTIAATYDGTSFTNQRTGRSIFISIDRVETN